MIDKYINILLNETKKSLLSNDVPVSALIVENNKIISKAHNSREKYQNVMKHAEIIALEKACKKKKTWHLDNCEIYVTMEPCLMCMNAISQSRIKRIYYILQNDTYKKIQSNMNEKLEINKIDIKNNELNIILKNFFKDKRK